MLIGHTAVWRYLSDALAHQRLSHAYGLVGKDQVGKRTLARQFAAQVLNTEEARLAVHPDYAEVARLVDEKTEKKRTEISVAQARELKKNLHRSSWAGGFQVAVINEADVLSLEAGNALLKLLEEPPEKSLLILLFENDAVILPTVRSRVQLLFLSTLSAEKLTAGLIEAGYPPGAVAEVAPLSFGRPGRAIELLTDQDKLAAARAEVERFKKIQGRPFHEQVALIEDLFKEADGERVQDNLAAVLDNWSVALGQALGARVAQGELPAAGRIAKTIDYLQTSKIWLREQVSPRLVLEAAVQKINL